MTPTAQARWESLALPRLGWFRKVIGDGSLSIDFYPPCLESPLSLMLEAVVRIAVMSDLHLEFDAQVCTCDEGVRRDHASSFYAHPPSSDAEVLVLAGDIHSDTQAIDWAAHNFTIPIVLINGNHEPYGHELFHVIAENRRRARDSDGRVAFLERATWTYRSRAGERIRFIGATLWTDFHLYGTPQVSMEIAQRKLEDFSLIKIERGYKLRTLRPSDVVRLCAASAEFLRDELSRSFEGITVVVTHYAPSPKSISLKFRGDPLNPAFASDFEELIRSYSPSLWIHGHMHESSDYVIGKTRVVCNPRGYFPDQLNPRFDPHFTVDVS
jgi:Calcineurin-like phosphoesterase